MGCSTPTAQPRPPPASAVYDMHINEVGGGTGGARFHPLHALEGDHGQDAYRVGRRLPRMRQWRLRDGREPLSVVLQNSTPTAAAAPIILRAGGNISMHVAPLQRYLRACGCLLSVVVSNSCAQYRYTWIGHRFAMGYLPMPPPTFRRQPLYMYAWQLSLWACNCRMRNWPQHGVPGLPCIVCMALPTYVRR